MKLKLDEQGHVVVQDGKPVYTHDDGKDVAFDAPSAVSKITALNAEAKGHREAKEAAETRAKAFEGSTILKRLAPPWRLLRTSTPASWFRLARLKRSRSLQSLPPKRSSRLRLLRSQSR